MKSRRLTIAQQKEIGKELAKTAVESEILIREVLTRGRRGCEDIESLLGAISGNLQATLHQIQERMNIIRMIRKLMDEQLIEPLGQPNERMAELVKQVIPPELPKRVRKKKR